MKFFVASKISDNMYETPEGFLVCVGVPIARTGNQQYGEGETPLEVGPDGLVDVYRDEKEVFRAETIASFQGKPITIGHPQDFVNPKNFKELAKGIIQNVRRGEGELKDSLISDLVVMDSEAISAIRGGLREVSCGYEAEYTQTEPGKGSQSVIIGNHLALVDEGRAGSSYAINDHKGAGNVKKSLREKIVAMFGKAQDEAIKLIEAEKGKTADEDKEDKEKAKDAGAYDELVQVFKDLGESIKSMGSKSDDADPDDKEKDPPKEEASDDDMGARLEKLEAAVAKLLKGKSGDEEEESEDESEEESEDDDFEETTMVGDAAEVAAKAEILSPGIKMSKDLKSVKVKSLRACYDTDDGKKVINKLTGGKAPAYDSAEQVELIFNATAALLKTDRNENLSRTKKKTGDEDFNSQMGIPKGAMTPEKMNEINKQHFARK